MFGIPFNWFWHVDEHRQYYFRHPDEWRLASPLTCGASYALRGDLGEFLLEIIAFDAPDGTGAPAVNLLDQIETDLNHTFDDLKTTEREVDALVPIKDSRFSDVSAKQALATFAFPVVGASAIWSYHDDCQCIQETYALSGNNRDFVCFNFKMADWARHKYHRNIKKCVRSVRLRTPVEE